MCHYQLLIDYNLILYSYIDVVLHRANAVRYDTIEEFNVD